MTVLEILSEPLTYQARLIRDDNERTGFRAVSIGEERSYVQDLWAAQRRGDIDAEQRLQRHAQEMDALRDEYAKRSSMEASFDFESRTINWSPGTGGYFAPPLWIIREFAEYPRSGRIMAERMPSFDLPVGAQSVNVPRLTAGLEVASTLLGAPAPSRDYAGSPASSNVVTFGGIADVPIQLLEQSPQGAHLDWVVFTDMESSYNYHLEQQLIFGPGVAGTLTGVINQLPTVFVNNPNIVYNDSSPTATKMYTSLGMMAAAVGRNRKMVPELWMLNTARLAWIATAEDQQQRPLMLANVQGTPGAIEIATIPGQANDAITNTFGASGLEDRIVLCKPSDWLLFESDRQTDVMGDVLSGTLNVRLQMRRYVAAVCRFPSGNSVMTGTGLVPVLGF